MATEGVQTMHGSMERSTAAAALANLFFSGDSPAAHDEGFGRGALGNLSSGSAWQAVVNGGGEAAVGAAMRLRTAGAYLHGPGPLRRARGAFTPIKKMAATPYGHQVIRHPMTKLTLLSTPHRDNLPDLTRASPPQYPLTSSAGSLNNQVVNGGMQISPAAPGIHPGVDLPESHGPTTVPTPRTAAPTSESTSEDKHPWGCGPWGALAAPSGSAQTVLPPLAYVPPAPLRPTSSVPPEREPPPPLAPQARFGPPPASYMPLVPPAATKKPPRAKKANPCASRTARAPLHYSSTPTPPPRHLHATSAPPS